MKLAWNFRFVAVVGLVASVAAARATVIWNFTTVYTGGDPGVAGPWFTILIQDGANAGDVNFTMLNDLPTTGIGALEFPSQLQFSTSTSADTVSLLSGSTGVAGFLTNPPDTVSGPIHDFNLEVDFPLGTDKLTAPTGASWTLHGAGLDETSFSSHEPPALIHLQGLPEANGSSSWVSTGIAPEPASLAALAIGAVAFLTRRRRK